MAFGGGFTDQARQSTVYVRHEGSTTEDEVPASQLTMIYPGDVVRVKTTVFWDAMTVFSPLAGPAVLAAARCINVQTLPATPAGRREGP